MGGVVRSKGRAHLPLFKNIFSTCCARAYVHVGRGEFDACGLVFRFPRGAVDFSWLIWCLVMVTNGREHFPANIQQGFLVFKGMACLATQLCFLIVRRAGGADNCVFSTIWYLASWTELLCVAVATYVIHCVVSPSRGDHCTWREFGAWFVALLAPTCATFAPTGRGGRSRIARVPFGSGGMPPELLQWVPVVTLSDNELASGNSSSVMRCSVALQATATCSAQGVPKLCTTRRLLWIKSCHDAHYRKPPVKELDSDAFACWQSEVSHQWRASFQAIRNGAINSLPRTRHCCMRAQYYQGPD